MVRECYIMANCLSERKVKWLLGRVSWFFIFGFKLYSVFGKPEHLDFASLLAKGREKKKEKVAIFSFYFNIF